MTIALATCAAVPRLSDDDRLLLPALHARGIRAEPAVWNAAETEWDRYDAVVIRSCWDYHLAADRFEAWTRDLESRSIPLWNPAPVLRWNARKTYLRDLDAAGVPTVPTRFVDQAETADLDATLHDAGWDQAVVKPVVSASAYETWRAGRGRAEDGERFRRQAARVPVMVQPFLPEIERDGEWSLCFFGGRYSHAVLKRPRPGDFRVQADHGGGYEPAEPAPAVVEEAERALRAAGRATVYARVDGCVVGGVLRLMELELLEPGMFLAVHPGAADRFARAIVVALRGPGQE